MSFNNAITICQNKIHCLNAKHLEKYSAKEPNAVSLMESLYEKHKKMVDEQLKH